MSNFQLDRRAFIAGSAALASGTLAGADEKKNFLIPAKAKRIIYLCHSGGQSQIDLFDYKPELKKWHGKQLPKSVMGTQRLSSNVENQGHYTVAGPLWDFTKNKKTGMDFSSLVPHQRNISEELCLIKSAFTEDLNHDPAICRLQTGDAVPGKASLGAWINYALGSMNTSLPSYVVMISQSIISNQSINSRLWGSAFLPSEYQGMRFLSSNDPVLFINNPVGMTYEERKEQIKLIRSLNNIKYEQEQDAEIKARNNNYELALKMQTSIPKLSDLSDEKESVLKMYGPDVKETGSFAYNCLMARRLIEKDVRFVQIYHRGWDQHEQLESDLPKLCRDTDQPSAALIADLKQRGLLEDTLIISSGEFGRTVFTQGELNKHFGRDHHGYCFSLWMAGAGIKKGTSFGQTDDFSYNITENKVTTREINATILNLMGIDNNKLVYPHRGLDERLTGTEDVFPIKGIIA